MKTLRCFFLPILAALLALAVPAAANVKVTLPPGGDASGFVLTVSIPVDNQTGDYVSGGDYTLDGSTLQFNHADTSSPVAPYSVGTVKMVVTIDVGWSEGTYPFALFGTPGASSPSGSAAFEDDDPALSLELILDSGGQPCSAGQPCHYQKATYPLTVSAPANLLYTVKGLGTLGGADSFGYGVNGSGQATGSANTTGDNANHAFLYSNGSLKDLGTLGGTNSQGSSINSSGQVVGSADTSGNAATHAFLYSGGHMTDLGTLGGFYSNAYGINSSGQVAGYSYTSGNAATHAFLYNSGAMTDLGTLGGTDSYGLDINSSGQVVGYSNVSGNGASHAFLYSSGHLTDLGTLGGNISEATSISISGLIAGYSSLAGNSANHAFLYSDSTMTDLGTLGGSYSYGYGVNVSGQVVGSSATPGDAASHAFLYTNGVMSDLNTEIDPSTGWQLYDAESLSGTGFVTGYGFHGGQYRAFLLTPAVQPVLSSLSPSSKAAGSGAFTLTVNGSHFAPNSLVRWRGLPQPTTFVSSTKLTVAIPASYITTAGAVKVRVITPLMGASGTLTFTVQDLTLTVGTLTRGGAGITAPVTLKNVTPNALSNVSITAAQLGGKSATSALPVNFGALAAGATKSHSLLFPGSAGASGSKVTLHVSGSYTGGTWSQSVTVTLP